MQRKLRVLQLGNPTAMYGAERWILALVRNLPSEIQSTVGVIIDDPKVTDPALCSHVERSGIETVRFRSHGRVSWSAVGQIRRYIRENGIHIIHTHGYKTDLIGLQAIRGTDCRIISTPHGWSVNAGVKLQLYELLDRLAFYRMPAVVPLSEDLYNGLARWPLLERRLKLIRNGVDIDEIDAVHDKPDDVAILSESDDFSIGYIGQLISRKNIDTLIEAFADAELPGKRLWLIGDGPQRGELEAIAIASGVSDRIHFLGFREDRIKFLRMFDVFVLPSSLEGIPRCLQEAMVAQNAVVATNIPGCTDLVQNGETGLLFDVGDEKQLRLALENLYADSDLRNELGANAMRFVRENYSAAAMARQYADLYEELAGHSEPDVARASS